MSEWQVSEKLAVSKINQKTIVVKSTTPSPIYVGQLWFDTGQNRYKVSKDGTNFVPVVKGILVVDDTQKSVAGTTETEVKYFRLAKTGYTPYINLHFIATLWTSNASYAGYLKVYIDGNATASLTLSTTSTSEAVVEGDIDVSSLASGMHTFHIKIYNADASTTTYTEHLEVWCD
jgi:hypothetical protein